MKLDGLVTSHPVYQPVNDPGEIDALFDTITYSKVGYNYIIHAQSSRSWEATTSEYC